VQENAIILIHSVYHRLHRLIASDYSSRAERHREENLFKRI